MAIDFIRCQVMPLRRYVLREFNGFMSAVITAMPANTTRHGMWPKHRRLTYDGTISSHVLWIPLKRPSFSPPPSPTPDTRSAMVSPLLETGRWNVSRKGV